jgi:hypothetical protein
MRINDRDVLGLIVARYKSPTAAMKALGLSIGAYYNWSTRGVPRHMRRPLWLLCRSRSIHFDESWIDLVKSPAEREAVRRASGFMRINSNTSTGAGDGAREAEVGESQGEGGERDGHGAGQRRATAGRSVQSASAQDQAGSR